MSTSRVFKKTISRTSAASARRGKAASLRKESRSAYISQKRQMAFQQLEASADGKYNDNTFNMYEENSDGPSREELKEIVASLLDTSKRESALMKVRTLLPSDHGFVSESANEEWITAMDALISYGLVDALLTLVASPLSVSQPGPNVNMSPSEIVNEALWSLCFISASSARHSTLVLPATPHLVEYLTGSVDLLKEQAAWILGNMASDHENRVVLLKQGMLPPLVSLISAALRANEDNLSVEMRAAHVKEKIGLLTVVCWALSALVQGLSPEETKEILQQHGVLTLLVYLVKVLLVLMRNHQTQVSPLAQTSQAATVEDLLTEVAFTLTFVTAQSRATFFEQAGPDFVMDLCSLLQTSSRGAVPVLRTIGNIVAGKEDNKMTSVALEVVFKHPAFLPHLANCFHPQAHRGTQKEAAWVLSNLTGGSLVYVDLILQSSQQFGKLVTTLFVHSGYDVQVELAYVLYNCMRDERSTTYLVDILSVEGVLQTIIHLLTVANVDVQLLALRMIEHFLRRIPNSAERLEELDGVMPIDHMLMSEYTPLYELSSTLLNEFYGE